MAERPTGTVSLLFTDIEGSTRLLQRLGDRYGEVLAEHRRLLREAIAGHHGREVDNQGDAIFAAFPTAKDAVAAAAGAQRSLAGHPWSEGVSLKVRMGSTPASRPRPTRDMSASTCTGERGSAPPGTAARS